MAKVGGLDLSMTATGIAKTGLDGAVTTALFKPKRKGDVRLVEISRNVAYPMAGAELVLIEDLPTHARAAGITGMVHGVVRVELISMSVPYAVVPPASLKKYATGRGNCDKTAMALAAMKRASLEFTDDNECDAWWLWVMAMDYIGSPVLKMPASQRESLAKITRKEG